MYVYSSIYFSLSVFHKLEPAKKYAPIPSALSKINMISAFLALLAPTKRRLHSRFRMEPFIGLYGTFWGILGPLMPKAYANQA